MHSIRSETSQHRQQGWVLIEVLMAAVVLAMALTATIGAATQGIDTVGTLKLRTLAHIVASNKLTELQLTRAWPAKKISSEKVEMAGSQWRVTVTTEPTVAEEFKDRITQATVSVALETAPDSTLKSLQGFLVKDSAVNAQKNNGRGSP